MRFSDLTPTDQRTEIFKYVTEFPCQLGLIGEAINEHKDRSSLIATMLCGDVTKFGILADKAIREYVGRVIDNDKDWSIEE